MLPPRRSTLVVPRDEARAHLDHGDAAPEAPVHLRELEADVAPTDDDQVLRQEIDLHHAGVREMGNLVEARELGNPGTGPDVDEDPVGLDRVPVHPNRVLAFKAGVPPVEGDVLHPLEPLGDSPVRLAGHLLHPRLDPGHVDLNGSFDPHAEVRGPARHIRGPRTGHERLGRDAADVDAGAPDLLALDHGHLEALAIHPVRERRPRLSGADHERVEAGDHVHASPFRGSALPAPGQQRETIGVEPRPKPFRSSYTSRLH
jgi:hypothetical protein